MLNIVEREQNRIKFVLERDGEETARTWARQTFRIYRASRKVRGYGQAYRAELVVSCVVLRDYLRTGNVALG